MTAAEQRQQTAGVEPGPRSSRYNIFSLHFLPIRSNLLQWKTRQLGALRKLSLKTKDVSVAGGRSEALSLGGGVGPATRIPTDWVEHTILSPAGRHPRSPPSQCLCFPARGNAIPLSCVRPVATAGR